MDRQKERCLVCHWEPNEPKDGNHFPDESAFDESGVYVCVECVTRMKTVSNFGLTLEELRAAAKAYKEALEEQWISMPKTPEDALTFLNKLHYSYFMANPRFWNELDLQQADAIVVVAASNLRRELNA